MNQHLPNGKRMNAGKNGIIDQIHYNNTGFI
jgi:hypothetical protein